MASIGVVSHNVISRGMPECQREEIQKRKSRMSLLFLPAIQHVHARGQLQGMLQLCHACCAVFTDAQLRQSRRRYSSYGSRKQRTAAAWCLAFQAACCLAGGIFALGWPCSSPSAGLGHCRSQLSSSLGAGLQEVLAHARQELHTRSLSVQESKQEVPEATRAALLQAPHLNSCLHAPGHL